MTKLRKRKSVLPQASMTGKIDELLIRFMSDPDTMKRLKDKYDEIRRDELTMDMVMNQTLEQSQNSHKHDNGTFILTIWFICLNKGSPKYHHGHQAARPAHRAMSMASVVQAH